MKADILGVIASAGLLARDSTNSSWVGTEGTTPLLASQDPFYSVNGTDISGYKQGEIIRSRQVGLANVTDFDVAYQLLYRSENSWGDARAAVTTIIVPQNNTKENVLSYLIPEDAADFNCAPSYELVSSSPISDIQAALDNGWVVNVVDYEGMNSSFAAGNLEGKTTLDSIRALKSVSNITGIDSPSTVLWGYSGGSIAAGWSAELQQSYAPDVNITAIALGGYVVDPLATALRVNNGIYVGFIPGALLGLASDYTALWDILNDQLLPDKRDQFLEALGLCVDASVANYVGQNIFSYFKDGEAVLNNTDLHNVLTNNTLGKVAPTIPMYIYQGVNDQIAPISSVDKVVEFYCENGTPVLYDRVPNEDHVGTQVAMDQSALDYFEQVFAGNITQGCTYIGAPINSTNSTTSSGNTTTGTSNSTSGSSNSSGTHASGSAASGSASASSTKSANAAATTGTAFVGVLGALAALFAFI